MLDEHSDLTQAVNWDKKNRWNLNCQSSPFQLFSDQNANFSLEGSEYCSPGAGCTHRAHTRPGARVLIRSPFINREDKAVNFIRRVDC